MPDRHTGCLLTGVPGADDWQTSTDLDVYIRRDLQQLDIDFDDVPDLAGDRALWGD